MNYTKKEICSLLNLSDSTVKNTIKYLKLESKKMYHEKAHKEVDVYSDEQVNQIKDFVENTPNKEIIFRDMSRIEKYGSLENFYKQKNEKSRKTKMERYGDPNYVNKEKISESNLKSWENNKESRLEQSKATKLERYGDENYNNSEKNKLTQIKHFGSVEKAHKSSAEKSKKTKLERYGNEVYNNSEKSSQTWLSKTDKEIEEIVNKRKETNLLKYGVEVPTQNEEIANKIKYSWYNKSEEEIQEFVNKVKSTKLKLYGDETYTNGEKCAETWNSKSEAELKEIEEKRKHTNLEVYGVEFISQNENVKNKIKETNLERYGKEYATQTEEVKEKTKNTNLKKWGVEYPILTKEVKDKARKTLWNNYGVEHPLQNDELLKKAKITNLNIFGTECVFFNEDVKNKIKNTQLNKLNYAKSQNLVTINDLVKMFDRDETTILNDIRLLNLKIIKFDNDFRFYIEESNLPILSDFFSKTDACGKSYSEKELVDFVKSIYFDEIVENTKRIIPPKELDIYIPKMKLAIEYNGLYWHDENHVDKNYHLAKTNMCNKKGIDLIHVFEDDWLYKKEIVKSMIASRLGVYKEKIFARKCQIKEIEKDQAKIFFDKNHLQGFAYGDLYLGLVFNDELIQCICINKKGWHDGNVELTRMVTKLNTQVVGGFSKLMKHISDYVEYKSITSYVYKAWFNGKGYIESGFKIVKENNPSYSYVVNGRRVHKSHFRKNKIKKMFERGELKFYDSNKTEHENMIENKIYRIYDCGTMKVIYE